MSDLAISEGSNSPLVDVLSEQIEGYEILSKIGTGGASDVYLGKDSAGNRVAIKRMLPPEELELYDVENPTEKLPLTPELIACYFDHEGVSLGAKKEFALGQELHHPHLMEVKKCIVTKRGTFLILELIEGKDFNHIKPGDLTPDQAKKCALDLLDVLIFALARGYMYADLCPRNVMLSRSGALKLIDLEGFEKIENHETYTPLVIQCLEHILSTGNLSLSKIHPQENPMDFLEGLYQTILEGSLQVKLSTPVDVGVLGKI